MAVDIFNCQWLIDVLGGRDLFSTISLKVLESDTSCLGMTRLEVHLLQSVFELENGFLPGCPPGVCHWR